VAGVGTEFKAQYHKKQNNPPKNRQLPRVTCVQVMGGKVLMTQHFSLFRFPSDLFKNWEHPDPLFRPLGASLYTWDTNF
jgi:hypothetical protein